MPDPHRTLIDALGRSAAEPSFEPLVEGLRDVMRAEGLPVDRVQLPLSRDGGFRHPTLGVVLVNWSHDEGFTGDLIPHADLDQLPHPGVVGTPFERIVLHGHSHERVDLTTSDGGWDFLRTLGERGYRDYVAFGLPMPGGFHQPISIATTAAFPDDVVERLHALAPLMALAVYGVYRTSQALRMASAYIGHSSGRRVLAGEIQRGHTRRVEAGILFCDIRGFTALSERLGAEGVVAVVNEVFQAVGDEAVPRGGEILKFIGDAMLIVFPIGEAGEAPAVAEAMVATAARAVARVHALADARALPLGIGFGGHIGEVVQGNIGTRERLDFTVMGPAVNLASRLESSCKALGTEAVFSDSVARHVPGLVAAGEVELKGIAAPVPVWTPV